LVRFTRDRVAKNKLPSNMSKRLPPLYWLQMIMIFTRR
jgi:hypothetical protein